MRPKSKIVAFLILSFILSVILGIGSVQAEEPLTITITPDGSVDPVTDLLEKNGTTYTFKSDIFGTILVQKNGIIIDGDGYTLQGRGEIDERGIYLFGPESYPSCKDVIIMNLRICNFNTGIFVPGANNNSIIGNYFENARIHILGCSDDGGLIKNNIFKDTGIFVDYNTCGLDVITENNFFNGWIGVGLSAVPIVEKNYWSDYNGTDDNRDGIGDTPHTSQYVLDEIVIDNYPLMTPLDLEVIPEFPSWTSLLIMLVAVVVVAVIYRRRLPKNRGRADK